MAKLAEVLAGARQWHVETTDVLAGLRSLPDGCVQCCVTSPPYFALRDYGVAGQIGLEATPDAYVAKMVEVFAEVRRVLRDDGTLWLNIGDSYHGSWGNAGSRPELDGKTQNQRDKRVDYLPRGGWDKRRERPASSYKMDGVKPKDLYGIPWQLAFALRADGWYLRSEIIWSKPNGMVESVTDRCTKAHEQIFMFAKSPRYFYDRLAITDPVKEVSKKRYQSGWNGNKTRGFPGGQHNNLDRFMGSEAAQQNIDDGANKRSVWHIPVGGYREAHFATFPPALPETCLKAGTSLKGCCAVCGAPWERVKESERVATRPGDGSKVHGANSRINKSRDPAHASEYDGKASVVGNRDPERHVTQTKTTGWQPTCDCNAATLPCLCLDPFNGAGTTGLVAAKGLGLRYIGFELNPEYAEMARRRIGKGFSEVEKQPKASEGQGSLFT